MEFVIGVTGASGMVYVGPLLKRLKKKGAKLHVVVSDSARAVMREESPSLLKDLASYGTVYGEKDFSAPVASGSYLFDGMVVLPCSMKSLGELAGGIADSLVVRAAEVCLKERRKLVVCPREAPVSSIHLRNMLAVSEAGAVVFPLMPSFYSNPKTIDEMVDNTVGRILDLLGLPDAASKRWGA